MNINYDAPPLSSVTIVGPRSLGPLSTLNKNKFAILEQLEDMHMGLSPLDYAS